MYSVRVQPPLFPQGTGSIRLAAELLKKHGGAPKVLLSTPTWGNHKTIFGAAGLEVESYPYFDEKTNGVAFAEMKAALSAADSGTIVLLHSCCHNPTGADLTKDEWRELAALMKARGLIPLFDTAYQVSFQL